jgi:hypothetical protein
MIKRNIKAVCREIGCSQIDQVEMIHVKSLMAAFMFDLIVFHVLVPES